MFTEVSGRAPVRSTRKRMWTATPLLDTGGVTGFTPFIMLKLEGANYFTLGLKTYNQTRAQPSSRTLYVITRRRSGKLNL